MIDSAVVGPDESGVVSPNGCFKQPKGPVLAKDLERWRVVSQFFVILRVTFDGLVAAGQITGKNLEIADKIMALFAEFDGYRHKKLNFLYNFFNIRSKQRENDLQSAWSMAYKIELYLVDLYPAPTLDLELQRRVEKCERLPDNSQCLWYRTAMDKLQKPEDETSTLDKKRTLLKFLIDDMQWLYTNREETSAIRRLIRMRASRLFLFATMFLSCFIFWFQSEDQNQVMPVIDLFLLSGTAGWWGATFSMLLGMQNVLKTGSLDDLKVYNGFWFVIVRSVIGMGAAMVFFFFIFSGLMPDLESGLFPELKSVLAILRDNQKTLLDNAEIHKLLFWCFLAGFSEKLVPDLLGEIEKRVQTKK